MQCNQPICGDFPIYCDQIYPYNPAKCRLAADVLGEGDVSSIIYPDGNIRYYFIPSFRYSPNVYNPNSSNFCNPAWNINTGMWFIRNVANPIPLAIFNQQFQRIYGYSNFKPHYSSQCNVNSYHCPIPGFQVKFHNDVCTSTTDIHYFYPCLRPNRYELCPKVAAVQVELPQPRQINPICQFEVICTKPCECCSVAQSKCKKEVKVDRVVCSCNKSTESMKSCMSIDETAQQSCCKKVSNVKSASRLKRKSSKKLKPCASCQSTNSSCACFSRSEKKSTTKSTKSSDKNTKPKKKSFNCECKVSPNSKHNKPELYIGECDLTCDCNSSRTTNKKSMLNHELHEGTCECNSKPKTTHKLVSTYTDQSSGSIAEGQETQTNCRRSLSLVTDSTCSETQTLCGASAQTVPIKHSDSCCANDVPIPKVSSAIHCNNADVEMWLPKTPLSRKSILSKSSKNLTDMHKDGCSTNCEDNSLTETDYETDEE